MNNVDAVVTFEDKWLQYKTFGQFMPRTELYNDETDILNFTRPIYKNRLSSRGSGVTWDIERIKNSPDEWIVQESIDIQEELRVYVIYGEIYQIGVVKQSMTEGNKAQGISSRALMQNEIKFSTNVAKRAPSLDFAGLDIAYDSDGQLRLMEVNRSPGFAKFYELTNINLADILYKSLNER